MNTNKIVKYVGIVLAILLIINIIMFLFQLVSGFGLINRSNKEVTTKYSKKIEVANEIQNEIINLDIELGASKLTFKETDDVFKVDTNNEYIYIKENGNTLKIKEKSHWFGDKNIETIIYVPKEYMFNELNIKMGAGYFEAYLLNGNKIDLELGSGKTVIKYINANNELDVDTGAGKFYLEDAIINKLDLDIGVGEVIISGDITSADIDAGVGSLTLNLNGSNEYVYVVNKGLGSIKINEDSVNNGRYGNGSNLIKIDGGIGTITVNDKSIR